MVAGVDLNIAKCGAVPVQTRWWPYWCPANTTRPPDIFQTPSDRRWRDLGLAVVGGLTSSDAGGGMRSPDV
jgi:hypothetical protein